MLVKAVKALSVRTKQTQAAPLSTNQKWLVCIYTWDYPSLSKIARPVGNSKTCTPWALKPLALSALLSMYRVLYVVVHGKATIG